MSDNFVGFAQSPKADPNRKLQNLKFELELSSSLRDVLSSLSEQPFYDKCFDPMAKFDFRQGGKLVFGDQEQYRGTFSQIQIPKIIILLTEKHGEIEFSFKEQKMGSRVVIACKKALLEQEISQWQTACEKIAQTLGQDFGGK